MLNNNKKNIKKMTNKNIDKRSDVMLKMCEITLCNVIFHQGNLPERVGRKAKGLKAGSDGGVLTAPLDDLNSSKPGCRDDNILLSESLLASLSRGFFYFGIVKN